MKDLLQCFRSWCQGVLMPSHVAPDAGNEKSSKPFQTAMRQMAIGFACSKFKCVLVEGGVSA